MMTDFKEKKHGCIADCTFGDYDAWEAEFSTASPEEDPSSLAGSADTESKTDDPGDHIGEFSVPIDQQEEMVAAETVKDESSGTMSSSEDPLQRARDEDGGLGGSAFLPSLKRMAKISPWVFILSLLAVAAVGALVALAATSQVSRSSNGGGPAQANDREVPEDTAMPSFQPAWTLHPSLGPSLMMSPSAQIPRPPAQTSATVPGALEPVPPPTPIPTPFPTPGSGCNDNPSSWADSSGQGCSWYEDNPDRCSLYGDIESWGWTANEVCCVCGDGGKPASAVPWICPVFEPSADDPTTDTESCSKISCSYTMASNAPSLSV